MATLTQKKWMCSYCGIKTMSVSRPMPGNCIRKQKTRDGKSRPHTWVRA